MNTAVWVDEGSSLNVDLLRKNNIVAPYFSHRFGNATKEILEDAKNQGFQPGIYSAWNWYLELNAEQYADFISSELGRIAWKGNPPVCIDIESGTFGTKSEWVAYTLAFFKRWRQLRPTRKTAWTLEGFQGANFSAEQVKTLISYNLDFIVQVYKGDMTPHEHSPIIDALMAGFPGEKIGGFYDSKVLPYKWRGFAFQQNNLPS